MFLMKVIYPVIISREAGEKYYFVEIPDLEAETQGEDIADSISMARDLIGLICTEREDAAQKIPEASNIGDIKSEYNSAMITLVDVDVDDYRRKNDLRAVRRNVTLPAWLDREARNAKINVSAVLQKALKNELNIV